MRNKAGCNRRLSLHRPQSCNLHKLSLYTLQLCILHCTHQLQPHCTALHVHGIARMYELPLLTVDERLRDRVDRTFQRLQVRDVLQLGGESGQARSLLLAV